MMLSDVCLSVAYIGPKSDVRQTDVRRASSLNAPYPRGGGIINMLQCRIAHACEFRLQLANFAS